MNRKRRIYNNYFELMIIIFILAVTCIFCFSNFMLWGKPYTLLVFGNESVYQPQLEFALHNSKIRMYSFESVNSENFTKYKAIFVLKKSVKNLNRYNNSDEVVVFKTDDIEELRKFLNGD